MLQQAPGFRHPTFIISSSALLLGNYAWPRCTGNAACPFHAPSKPFAVQQPCAATQHAKNKHHSALRHAHYWSLRFQAYGQAIMAHAVAALWLIGAQRVWLAPEGSRPFRLASSSSFSSSPLPFGRPALSCVGAGSTHTVSQYTGSSGSTGEGCAAPMAATMAAIPSLICAQRVWLSPEGSRSLRRASSSSSSPSPLPFGRPALSYVGAGSTHTVSQYTGGSSGSTGEGCAAPMAAPPTAAATAPSAAPGGPPARPPAAAAQLAAGQVQCADRHTRHAR